MKIKLIKKGGKLIPYMDEDREKVDSFEDGAIYEVDIKNMDIRTLQQNKAMHLFFTYLAEELNSKNMSVTQVLKPDVKWSLESVKENLWKPIFKTVTGKNSTTKATKEEITKTYDVLNKALGERLGFNVEFPSKELLEKE